METKEKLTGKKTGLKYMKNENKVFTNNYYDEMLEQAEKGPMTLLDFFKKRHELNKSADCFGTLKENMCVYETNEEIFDKINKVASFLAEITDEKENIGIYSVNRAEWVIAEYAGYSVNCPNIPLYSTFQPDALEFVLEQTELTVLFGSADKARNLMENILKGNKRQLKHLILFEENPEVQNKFEDLGVKVHNWHKIIKSEQNKKHRRKAATKDDIASICYTSGTSGNPKGVILKHSAFAYHIQGFFIGGDVGLYPKFKPLTGVYLSYLPLAHVFERICFSVAFSLGLKIAFFGGNPKTLQKDFEIIQPSFIAAVPRVLNIFYERIMDQVNELGWFKRFIFKCGLKYKNWRQQSGVYKSWFWDFLVFNKVKKKFGGNLESCLCGGASINPETVKTLNSALCCKIFQGYGQTEGLAANVVQPFDFNDCDTVGVPFVSCKVRLSPVEGYDPKSSGELLMAGPSITEGYYKEPEKTEDAFEIINGERWLKTGDVFRYANNRFYVIGRVKELFKTSYGEYIVPEKLENCFVGGEISEIFITGTKYSDSLMAVVVPKNTNVTEKEILSIIKQRAMKLVENKVINKYEIPTAVYLCNSSFANLNDGKLITPSLKKRRKQIYDYFQMEIEERMSKKK
ncbi:Long chain fatty acid CoA ligase [Nucleospora cyclopteri]